MTTKNRGFWFVAPSLLVIGAFFGVPVVAALLLSLTDFDIYALASLDNLRFVGARNYLELFEAPLFWQSLANTCYFVLLGVPLYYIAISRKK